MANWYVDTDGGSDAAGTDGVDWATAHATLDNLLSATDLGAGGSDAVAGGDRVFFQGAAADTAAGGRTLDGNGTGINPVQVIGVADGTTAEPPTDSDLAVTLPKFASTGASVGDISFNGSLVLINIDIEHEDVGTLATGSTLTFINCIHRMSDRLTTGNYAAITHIDTEIIYEGTAGNLRVVGGTTWEMLGGKLTPTTAPDHFIDNSTEGPATIIGVDCSGTEALGSIAIVHQNQHSPHHRLINCLLPASYTLLSTGQTGYGSVSLIGCSTATSKGNDQSYQDYEYQDYFGTVDVETTVVRTGGADDQATGVFSYALVPTVDATLGSSEAAIKSPWMRVWIDGGSSKTLKVFTAHDNADSSNADLNQDDLWCEYFTPDPGDTTKHDVTMVCTSSPTANVGDAERLFPSATATGTDDTSDTWPASPAALRSYARSFNLTMTPGYTGWAYARIVFAKRYAATPVTVYVDPKIEVT